MTPLISVLLPVFNAKNDLRRAINSLQRQTFKNFEIIAIDDGSTDGSGEVLDQIAQKESRLRVFHQPNAGALGKVLNRAAELAQGQYLARQDADDASAPERLERQASYLDSHTKTGLCATWTWYIDTKLGPLFSYEMPDKHELLMYFLHKGMNPLTHGSVMMRRDIFIKSGGYRGSLAEDFDLWLRLSDYAKIGMLEKTGYYYWRSIGGINTGAALRQKALIQLLLKLHHERTVFHKEQTSFESEYLSIVNSQPAEEEPGERLAAMQYARGIYLLKIGRMNDAKVEFMEAARQKGGYARKAQRNLRAFGVAPLLRLFYGLINQMEPFRYARTLPSGTKLPATIENPQEQETPP